MGGLIGGEAALVDRHRREGNAICGSLLSRAIAYSMAVLEVNSSMGLIVASPTAGSSGVVPGVLLALKEEYHLDDADLLPPSTTPARWATWPCATPRWREP